MDDKLILNISKVNPKSLDIELSHFSSDMTFIIYNSDKTFSEELLVTSNSINLNPNIKTLCINIDEESIELENHLLKSNIEYLLEISINDTVIDSSNVLFSNYPAPIQPIVKTYGNRLIQIQFEYPIKHLIDKTTQTSGFAPGGALANFYIKYFNSDVDQGTKPTPTWPGYLIVDVGLDIEPFNATISNDLRSLLIQSNIKSLPIGNHRLQVATSKIADHSLSGNHLTDFLNRDVPISEIDFMLTASQYSATVETLTVIDPQTVEVKFSSPVLDSFGIITVESVASPQRAASHVSSEVQRKRDTLDTLIFKMDSNTFISAGPNSVIVSDVVDCYGLIVNSFKYEANLELPSPELLSVLQDKTSLSETETKLDIIFSHSMNQASLEIKGNYFITKKDSTFLIPVKNIIFNPNFPTQASIILEPQLSSGIYTLRVENLIDIYGSDLINNIKDFSIIDITKPSVISILGTAKESPTDLNDSILIKFSEYMATDNVHGINNGINFKLSPNRVNFTSLESAKATLFKNNSWVRFNLNEKVLLSATPTAESLLRIGYISLDKVFYVTDVSGNIVEFCDTMKVSKLLPILNLDGGSASITESNQITFTLSNSLDPDEMFDDKAFAEDFIFTATNLTEPLIPSIVSVSDDLKSLIFTFVG
ncbi:MAG: hypothetical protein ACRDDY_11665, partial [Clostridium sp.]|uniref:hypothetical protein n=1 Tax=Clostridium sp. TaxID=1506 RepID=UPI003EE4C512